MTITHSLTGIENGAPAQPSSVLMDFCDSAALVRWLDSNSDTGLSTNEVAARLAKHGSNKQKSSEQLSPYKLFFDQFRSSVVLILVAATAVSLVMGEQLQALGIAVAVAINALVGFCIEYKSQLSIAELNELSGPRCRVCRDGVENDVAVEQLVPGDIVFLAEGDRVPADLRILQAANLSVDESQLSGESEPIYKSCNHTTNNEKTKLYQGSLVVSGKAKTIVTATAGNTKLGVIGSQLLRPITKSTPLQTELEILGRQLSIFISVVCLLVFIAGIARGENAWRILQTSIALAIAAIPEGLPVIATLSLAEGSRIMRKNNALVRKLSAVETLGCTEIICTDKTGTLTKNQQIVTDILVHGHHLKVFGTGFDPSGILKDENGNEVKIKDCAQLKTILLAGALCNDAKLESHGNTSWHVHGDPTEGALLVAASRGGIELPKLLLEFPRVTELPFDMQRKRMSTIHADGEEFVAFVKGAPENVLEVCHKYQSDDGVNEISNQFKLVIDSECKQLAKQGLRVLAFASKRIIPTSLQTYTESEMVFLGVVGMRDEIKANVQSAISECQSAGIQVIMVTGDHINTAQAVAREIGIATSDTSVLQGNHLSCENVLPLPCLQDLAVVARVSPEQKLQLVKTLQSSGKVVAMSGDGINDAPALKQADVGVSMGQKGTTLARESADLVLTDDNFDVIVRAIKQGRVIYANIRGAICYLLTASFASVFTVCGATFFNFPLPLSPVQLLWLNLIMHIFPGLGLAMQKSYPDIMKEPPRGKNQSLLGRKQWSHIVLRAIAISTMTLFAANYMRNAPVTSMQTVVLCTISLSLLLQSWSWLATKQANDAMAYFYNPPMQICTLLGLVLLSLATSYSPVQTMLATVSPTSMECCAIVFYSIGSFLLTSCLIE